MVTLVRYLMILVAILLSPFYALWVGGGWAADRLEKHRTHSLWRIGND